MKKKIGTLLWDLLQALILFPAYYYVFELLLNESLKISYFDQNELNGKILLMYMSFTAYFGLKFAIAYNKRRMVYPVIFEASGCLVWVIHIPAMVIFSFLTGWLFFLIYLLKELLLVYRN